MGKGHRFGGRASRGFPREPPSPTVSIFAPRPLFLPTSIPPLWWELCPWRRTQGPPARLPESLMGGLGLPGPPPLSSCLSAWSSHSLGRSPPVGRLRVKGAPGREGVYPALLGCDGSRARSSVAHSLFPPCGVVMSQEAVTSVWFGARGWEPRRRKCLSAGRMFWWAALSRAPLCWGLGRTALPP